jgi:hypothetical protein
MYDAGNMRNKKHRIQKHLDRNKPSTFVTGRSMLVMPQAAKDTAGLASSQGTDATSGFGVFHAGLEMPNAKLMLNAAVTRIHKEDKVGDEADDEEVTDEAALLKEDEGKRGEGVTRMSRLGNHWAGWI